jgi:hypothetical protein
MKLNQHCSLSIGATLYVLEKHGLYQIYPVKLSISTTLPFIAKIGKIIQVTEE